MYKAKDIASYIVNYCQSFGMSITNLRLQKLLYLVQGEYYRQYQRQLISDDFYAWQLGPVVPNVYSEYSIYSSFSLPKQKNDVCIGEETLSFIGEVIKKYANTSTWNLVDITHRQDPWKYSYGIFGDNAIIPFKTISSFWGKDNE